jgi:hypothetical protein
VNRLALLLLFVWVAGACVLGAYVLAAVVGHLLAGIP